MSCAHGTSNHTIVHRSSDTACNICPGRVHLVHNFRTAKQKINNKRAAEKAAAEAAAKAEAK